MPKKRVNQNKNISPYEEMQFPKKEVESTLPFKYIQKKEEEENNIPPPNQKDYLDDFSMQQPKMQRNFSQPLMYNDEGKENLIIDLLKVDWERIEHIIRGHKPKVDEEGNEYFVKIEGHYLNEYGVNSVLHYLSFYLSKDIRLGRYDIEQVQIIMKQFARQFTDWFFDNIEEFGLDTPEKKKMSKMFVHAVIDLVDASYSCAIQGKTIELMLKQFSVMQQEPIYPDNYNANQHMQTNKPNIMQRIFG